MKTIFAKEKSEYSHLLIQAMRIDIGPMERIHISDRMKEIERLITDQMDEIQIIVTTKNTKTFETAPAMTMENILKS